MGQEDLCGHLSAQCCCHKHERDLSSEEPGEEKTMTKDMSTFYFTCVLRIE